MDHKWHALYLRVSTDAQYEEGYSIEAQMKKLEQWCHLHDIDQYEFYIDGGYSGSNLNRPQMQRMISDIQAKKVEAVVVYKLDRISRSQRDTIYLLEDIFTPNETGFVSLNENFDTTTPYGKAMIGILSVFAQLERENIRERTRMGMRERLNKGMWRGTSPPFGYDYNSSQGILVPNADADTVREIFRLYLDGISTYKLAKMFGFKGDRQIAAMLDRPTYTGLISYKGELLSGRHEPIIDESTWNLVRQERKRRTRSVTPGSKYLLAGLLECGICHAKMRYQMWGNSMKIYCYSQQTSKPHLIRDPDCNNEKADAKQIEALVIQDMLSFVKRYRDDEVWQRSRQDTEIVLAKRKQLLSGKLRSLYNLYAGEPSENIHLLAVIDENKQALQEVENAITHLQDEQQQQQYRAGQAKRYASIADGWDQLNSQEKRNIVLALIRKVVITNQSVEIYYRDVPD